MRSVEAVAFSSLMSQELDIHPERVRRAVVNLLERGLIKMDSGKAVISIQKGMPLVIIESPYAGDVEGNEAYARACVRDSLSRGEAPIASHLLYTQPGILDDLAPAERQHGIDAGRAWLEVAHLCAVYADRGISRGMEQGIGAATRAGVPVDVRTLNV